MCAGSRRADIGLCCIAAAALLSAPGASASPPYYPPYPTPEQREQWRKGSNPFRVPPAPAAPRAETLFSQADYDVTKYFLDLEFVPATRAVKGSVTMDATSLVPGLTEVVLDLYDNMTITSIDRGGVPLAYARGGNQVTITLDRPFDAGDSFQIITTYRGVPEATGFGSIGWNKYFWGSKGMMVWTLSEPEGARSWWPCKDVPDDKAMVEEWWTVPSTWIAAGNGVLTGTSTLPNSRKRFKWLPSHPLTTYLVMIAATDYGEFGDTYTRLDGGTMPVHHYVYKEDLANAQESFRPTVPMIRYYAETFGEYPFVEDKYGMSAFPWGGAMEHTTNTSYGYFMIDGGHGNDYIIAHELSHQWWGDSLSPRDWKNVWLNEGFASWSEASWAEHLNGPQGYHDYMMTFWRQHFDGPLFDPYDPFGTTVYSKGAWAVHMLRGVVGDDAFFAALRDYYATYKDGVVDTPIFQAVEEQHYGRPLDWFFDEWVYAQNSPAYEWGWTTADRGDGTYRTYVRVKQVQTDAGTFTMPLRLKLVTGAGDETRTAWNDSADQWFQFDTAAPVSDALFDPDDWVLKASTQEITLDDADGDGVPDPLDNCVGAANAAQADLDADGTGDACDPDIDGDGLANELDCAPMDPAQGRPPEVADLDVSARPGTAQLTWSAVPLAASYDIQRGGVGELAAGDYGSCLATGVTDLQYDDPAIPPAGQGWQYLVAGRNAGCGGEGSLGSRSGGGERPAACP